MNRVQRAGRAATLAGRHPLRYARQASRLPLEQQAADRIGAQRVFELADVTNGVKDVSVRLAPRDGRHAWSLGAAEQLVLQVLLLSRRCGTAFEIGTFNGGTTRLLAETLPEDGIVWTIDLDPAGFDASQAPADFEGARVGEEYANSPAAHKIVQLLGDSMLYDFSRYRQSADLVLVDAGHEYENGFADTTTALELVKPGGIVLWDDYTPYWHGLVNGICDAMGSREFGPLAGTSLAVYADSRSQPSN
jgi:hypothetical protein